MVIQALCVPGFGHTDDDWLNHGYTGGHALIGVDGSLLLSLENNALVSYWGKYSAFNGPIYHSNGGGVSGTQIHICIYNGPPLQPNPFFSPLLLSTMYIPHIYLTHTS